MNNHIVISVPPKYSSQICQTLRNVPVLVYKMNSKVWFEGGQSTVLFEGGGALGDGGIKSVVGCDGIQAGRDLCKRLQLKCRQCGLAQEKVSWLDPPHSYPRSHTSCCLQGSFLTYTDQSTAPVKCMVDLLPTSRCGGGGRATGRRRGGEREGGRVCMVDLLPTSRCGGEGRWGRGER